MRVTFVCTALWRRCCVTHSVADFWANSLKIAKSNNSNNSNKSNNNCNFDMQAATDPMAISMQHGEHKEAQKEQQRRRRELGGDRALVRVGAGEQRGGGLVPGANGKFIWSLGVQLTKPHTASRAATTTTTRDLDSDACVPRCVCVCVCLLCVQLWINYNQGPARYKQRYKCICARIALRVCELCSLHVRVCVSVYVQFPLGQNKVNSVSHCGCCCYCCCCFNYIIIASSRDTHSEISFIYLLLWHPFPTPALPSSLGIRKGKPVDTSAVKWNFIFGRFTAIRTPSQPVATTFQLNACAKNS